LIAADRPNPFELSDEQRAIGDLARDFAQGQIAPHIAAWDKAHTFPRELYTKLNAIGLMGMLVPEAYGGVQTDYVSYALAIEEVAKIDAGTAVTLSVHSMICAAIATLGSDAQKDAWLAKIGSGDCIAGFALTEPDAGSDAAAIRGRAVRDGDAYLLNGRKQWCTNGSVAGVAMVMMRTGGSGAKGISAFLVGLPAVGVHVENVTEKLGIHTSNTVDLTFADARVAADSLLGNEGDGLSSALGTLTAGRIGIAAQAVGILAACLDASVKFAKERSAFGRPIGSFEGISFKIARMVTDLDAARLLTYRAAALADAGKPFAVEASKAKLFASTAARMHASEALQIHGGYGYTTEFPVERYYRDAKITEIYEGSSEIQQLIIARSLLGRLDRD
jgi:alkylation response protein AidB-like acyl-CoA dehydrogenase